MKVIVAHAEGWIAPLLTDLLSERGEVVGESASGESAVRLSEVFRPDVLIASEVLSDGVIDNFLSRFVRTGTRVAVLDENLELPRMIVLAEHGVTGMVDHSLSPEEFGQAVLDVAHGGVVFPMGLVTAITGEWRMARRSNGVVSSNSALTTREIEVLGAMVDGMATKAIGYALGLSAKTVENHKTRIFAKLGVRTQAEAVSVVLAGRLRGQLEANAPLVNREVVER